MNVHSHFIDRKIDELAKSRKLLIFVIPAQAGIQEFQSLQTPWIPAFAGMTTFCERIIGEVFYDYQV